MQTLRVGGAFALAASLIAACGSSPDTPSSHGSTTGSGSSTGSATGNSAASGTSGSGGHAGTSGIAAATGASGAGGSGASGAAASGAAASGSPGSTGASTSGTAASSGTSGAATVASPTACALSRALRGTPGCHFLFGMGNDLNDNHNIDGAYTLGTTVDLHYAYLVGLPTMGGWPDWNASGGFVDLLASTADAHGVTPMFTLYAMASKGNGNLGMMTDDTAMNLYWQGARLMFQRLAAFNKPAVVHLEPDFWGFAMQMSQDGTARVIVTEHASECAGLPDNLIGMAGCLLKMGRMLAPKVAVGFHASNWGGTQDAVIQFFKTIHADQADFVATDVIDRDAGCYEVGTDPNCMGGGGGPPWYWDETNKTGPNFQDNLTWAKAVHDGLKLPMIWWQVPFGVPSDTPGTAGHYRDNRVHYIFQHVDQYAAAGGVGVVFGTGAGNQTDITTDGGQFKTAAASYFANPLALQ